MKTDYKGIYERIKYVLLGLILYMAGIIIWFPLGVLGLIIISFAIYYLPPIEGF